MITGMWKNLKIIKEKEREELETDCSIDATTSEKEEEKSVTLLRKQTTTADVLGPVVIILIFWFIINRSISKDRNEEKEEKLQSSRDTIGDEILDTFENASCNEDAVDDGW